MVDLLSRHIYSSPRVYLRELLQNGVDAITARRELNPDSPTADSWSIRITPLTPDNGEFSFTDQGIGLTYAEAAELLSTVGATSKRDILDFPRQDFLGQFGIGLLSCFMVADEIQVITRSAKGGPAVEWIGSADGSFSIRQTSQVTAVGTLVKLKPRFDAHELLGPAAVVELAQQFGRYLEVPIRLGPAGSSGELINEPAVFVQEQPDPADILRFGTELLGVEPLDWFKLSCPQTGTRGLAFVLPFSPPPGSRQAAQLYLGRMLVSTDVERILPNWAFFVRICVNSTGLTPTASREAVVQDLALEVTRSAFADSIRSWIIRCASSDINRLELFLAVHERAMKQMVQHDPELAQIMTGHLTLETSVGRRSIDQLVADHRHFRYTETVDEFRQVVGLLGNRGLIVNGGYLWDAELTRSLAELYSVQVERIDLLAELDNFDPPPLAERGAALALEERADAALAGRDCQVVVRIIGDGSTPAVFVADPELFRRLDRTRSAGTASPLWRQVLSKAESAIDSFQPASNNRAASRLCLNWPNRLVQTLATLADQTVFDRCIQLLFAQAQLAGHRPLSIEDRRLLNSALSDLIALSVGVGDIPLSSSPPNTGQPPNKTRPS
jgi:molecular chaperone HtpG